MARSPWKRYVKLAVKSCLAVVVLGFVGWHVLKTWRDLDKHGASLHVEPAWIVVAGALYLLGLTACALFFARVMAAGPNPVDVFAAVRAYLISHLGKYVPGKAMVVVMRVGLLVPYGARPATAALGTFYETLVMMASGAIVAAIGFGLSPGTVQRVPLTMALGLSVLFLIVVSPQVFPRITAFVVLPFPNVGHKALPDLPARLLGVGLLWSSLGWVLLGLSQVAVIRAVSPDGISPTLWPLVTASVALATVAGFVVAVLPAGLGVRDLVLMITLAPVLGENTAAIAALTLRLTWVAAEALAAGLLALVRPAPSVLPTGDSIA